MSPETALDLYLSSSSAIIRMCADLRRDARTNPTYDADMVDRVVRLADRHETKELRAAREKYERMLKLIERAAREPFPAGHHFGG